MSLYFYLLEGSYFSKQIQPALAASWQQRTFEPCRELCRLLLPAAQAFCQRYRLGADKPLVFQAAEGLSFDRHCWRYLVGEILMFGAVEIPEIQTSPDALCCLLAQEQYLDGNTPRERFAPIQQVHFGTRDLVFGTGYYHPEFAGWNDRADVARLSGFLASVNPGAWTVADLAGQREVADELERADELEFIREWFPGLRELYQRASDRDQVVVCETIS